jgi:hypothetical protein
MCEITFKGFEKKYCNKTNLVDLALKADNPGHENSQIK